jgi:hypothetical protein
MDRIDIMYHLEEINNIALCRTLNENEESSCNGCPFRTDSSQGCIIDDLIDKLENM